jgi:hypothetical protein
MNSRLTSRQARSERGAKMNCTLRWGYLGLAALTFSGALGCAGAPETSPESYQSGSITVTDLPDVPSCDEVRATGDVRVMTIQGQPDLYLVTVKGEPLCMGTGADLQTLQAHRLVNVTPSAVKLPSGEENSDPMPLREKDNLNSDPMPIHPKVDALEQRR